MHACRDSQEQNVESFYKLFILFIRVIIEGGNQESYNTEAK
jgi:hypothetical protein